MYSGADKSLALPDRKKQLKGRHFSSDAEVIAAAETWLDGQNSEFFFERLARVKSLVAVASFLPGRAKDLSAPRYRSNRSAYVFEIMRHIFSNRRKVEMNMEIRHEIFLVPPPDVRNFSLSYRHSPAFPLVMRRAVPPPLSPHKPTLVLLCMNRPRIDHKEPKGQK